MGQMVMVMTPWDYPICLTRAWCLIELYACRSSGGRFDVAFPPAERARFLSEIVDQAGAFYHMLGKVNTAKSECSRESDRQRIFAAVEGLDGGFRGLDRGVLHDDGVAAAAAAGGGSGVQRMRWTRGCRKSSALCLMLWEACCKTKANTTARCRCMKIAWRSASASLATITLTHCGEAARDGSTVNDSAY
jgi:hypothetical protein